jgi:hypothetical protein
VSQNLFQFRPGSGSRKSYVESARRTGAQFPGRGRAVPEKADAEIAGRESAGQLQEQRKPPPEPGRQELDRQLRAIAQKRAFFPDGPIRSSDDIGQQAIYRWQAVSAIGGTTMTKFSAANWAVETVLVNHDNNFHFTEVAAALNNEGLLEFFLLDNSGNLNRGWQIQVNGGWGPGVSMAPYSARQITLAANQDGHLELFYPGTDANQNLYHIWETATAGPEVPLPAWSSQKQIASDSADQISALISAGGEMQIFYVGTNNKLYYNVQTGPNGGEGNNHWKGEKSLSNTKILEVTAVADSKGNPVLFYRGKDNGIYYNVSPFNNGEARFAPYLALQLIAVLNSQKLIEIFYVGTNNLLYFNRQTNPNDTGAWLGETQLLGVQARQVAVAMDSNGVLEVFFTDMNNNLFHTWETATDKWAPAQSFQNSKALQMTAVANQDGHLELFYIGTNGVLYHTWQVPM